MLKLKKQCEAIKRVIDIMEEGIGESMQLAESKQDLPYVIKSHAFKRKFNESKADLRVLENKYSDLEKKS